MKINYKLINGMIGRTIGILASKCYCSMTFNKVIKVYIYRGLIEYVVGDGVIGNSLSSYIIINYC